MHAHVQKHSCWPKIARPERSVPPCLPAAETDRALDCFRVSERTVFDDGGRLFDPSVSTLDVSAVAANTYGCWDISSVLFTHINTGYYKGRKQACLVGACGFGFECKR